MARYRKDRLPENQKIFARTLGGSDKPAKPKPKRTQTHKLPTPNTNLARCTARTNWASRGSLRAVRGSTRDFPFPAGHRLISPEIVKGSGRKAPTEPKQNYGKFSIAHKSQENYALGAAQVPSWKDCRGVAPGRRWEAN